MAYIVGGLERATPYTFSILAYTVADEPRSIHLTAITLRKITTWFVTVYFHTSLSLAEFDPLIVEFGIYGSGVDKVTRYTYNNRFQVHCTTSRDPSIMTYDW